MNIWHMIFGLLFMLLLYFSIHLIVNRGKIEMKYMFILYKNSWDFSSFQEKECDSQNDQRFS